MVLILNMNFDTVLDKNYGMKLLQLIADPVWVLPISQFPTKLLLEGTILQLQRRASPKNQFFAWKLQLYLDDFLKVITEKSALSRKKLTNVLIFFDQWFGLKQPSIVLTKSCSENMQQIYRRAPMPNCDLNKIAKQHL